MRLDVLDAAISLLDDCLICYVRDYARDFFDGLTTLGLGAAAAAGAAAGTVAGTATSAVGAARDSFGSAYQHSQVHDRNNPYDSGSPAHADYDRKSQQWKNSGVHPSYWPDPPVAGDTGVDEHKDWWAGPQNAPSTPRYFGGVRQD